MIYFPISVRGRCITYDRNGIEKKPCYKIEIEIIG